MSTVRDILRWTPLLLAVILLASGWGVAGSDTGLRNEQDALREVRMTIQDRLPGLLVSLEGAGWLHWLGSEELSGGIADRESVVWFLDVDRCPTCLREVGPWNRLAETNQFNMIVVFLDREGDGLPSRIFKNTLFAETSSQALGALIGSFHASTKLHLDELGYVLMADTRHPALDCGSWEFETRVQVLTGNGTPDMVRPLARVGA